MESQPCNFPGHLGGTSTPNPAEPHSTAPREPQSLPNPAELYSPQFYADTVSVSLSSARVIVPLVIELLHPRSVVDVGCGTGAWLSVFAEHGVSITGIDGPWVRPEALLFPPDRFLPADLRALIVANLRPRADLAVCLEVAEHLSPELGPPLVFDLTMIAPAVLFSAAVPGQEGTDHVNLQPPEYWVELFAREGFEVSDPIGPKVRGNPFVAGWYAENTRLFRRRP